MADRPTVGAGPVSEVAHLLLTRFNLKYGGLFDARYSDAWMAHRLDLFERFCLPSVARQIETDFRWLIFFDRERSEPWLATIDRLVGAGRFEPVFLDGDGELIAEVGRRAAGKEVLLTSRLDNDDVIHPEYIADIRLEATTRLGRGLETPFVIDVRRASWWDRERGDVRRSVNRKVSPYATLVERNDGKPRTVLACGHNELAHTFGRVCRIDGYRTLTVVHDQNVLNSIRRRGPAARMWLRLRDGYRYLGGAAATRALAEFGVVEEEEAAKP